MKIYTVGVALCTIVPSILAAPYHLSNRAQPESCSVANGIKRCCPGNLSMQVINNELSGYCCVPVQNSRMNTQSGPCPQGQVAVSVTAKDYDRQVANLMNDKNGGSRSQASGGADTKNPLAFAGAMGILATSQL